MNLQQWLDYQQRLHPLAMELGLDRVSAVATRMGLARPGKRVVSVAGTNGKGSTVAFAESIARAAGWRTGAYTSPHLLRYNERVRIDGQEAGDEELIAAFERVEAARGDTDLTFFEFGTLAALALFERAQLDLAVLEVGLGGRLDAVNLVDPDVAVITSIALDHLAELGADREKIAVEKAGILRPLRPAVLAEADPPEALLREARRIDARLLRAGRDFRAVPAGDGWILEHQGVRWTLPPPRMPAPAQVGNAAAAIAALRALPGAEAITEAAARQGVAEAFIPGRLQRIGGEVEILVDVAHNPQAAQQLAQWLIRNRPAGSTQAVFAALGDKDIPNLIAPLLTCVDAWCLAGLEGRSERGIAVDALWAQVAGLLSRTLATRHASVEEAFAVARARARAGDRILVYGSFLTAGAALAQLNAGAGPEQEPPPPPV
ncbi:MAG TPA: bifunctional tetrahydrofolate synthase/dihydrofolate synthase [Xanthomonadaceae bacterium]|nr:bifunctional tetrahydrofolate synthase/dihydrofolate synthase [Xanthomonadaceae bacterium]